MAITFKRLRRWCRSAFLANKYESLKLLLDHDRGQSVRLPNGENLEIIGYRETLIGRFALTAFYLFTLFVGFLLLKRKPALLMKWFCCECTVHEATKVVVRSCRKGEPLVTVHDLHKEVGVDKWFHWRQFRFTCCPSEDRFQRVAYVGERGESLSEIYEVPTDGAPRERAKYGLNRTKVPSKSWIYVLLNIVVHPFRLYQVLAIGIWSMQKYSWYTVFFALMTAIEILYQMVLRIKHDRELQRISLKHLVATTVTVVKNEGAERVQVASQDLLPGDVIEISSNGSIVSCDAVILSGNCFVIELLSKPTHKFPLPKSQLENFDAGRHKQHTILRGSTVLLTKEKVIALVTRTGWATDHGGMLAVRMERACNTSAFYRDLKYLYFFLGLVALCSAIYGVCRFMSRYFGNDAVVAFSVPLDFVTVCLPPIFSLALAISNFYPLARLYKNGFRYCHWADPSSAMHTAGASDCVCILQNAVLKDAESCVMSVLSSSRDRNWMSDDDLTLCMATCNSLTRVNDRLVGSCDEIKLFPSVNWKICAEGSLRHGIFNCDTGFNVQSSADCNQLYQVTRIYCRESPVHSPFLIVRVDRVGCGGDSWYFLKGPLQLVTKCVADYSDREMLVDCINEWKRCSRRIVAFAGRRISHSEDPHEDNKDIILGSGSFRLLGVASLQYRTSQQVNTTIAELRAANIRPLLISGCDQQEAIALARQAGIVVAKEPISKIEISHSNDTSPPSLFVVDLPEAQEKQGQNVAAGGCDSVQRYAHVVLEGNTLDALEDFFPELVEQIIGNVSILASADVSQSNHFLRRMHNLNPCMVVCKENADLVSVAGVESVTLMQNEEPRVMHRGCATGCRDISCLTELFRHSRASLVTSLGLTKCLVCYAATQMVSSLLLYESNRWLPNPQYLYIDFALIMLPVLLFAGTSPSLRDLSSQVPAKSLIDLRQLPSMLVQIVLIVVGQWLALVIAQHQPWFQASSLDTTEQAIASDEDYAVFALSLFQYLSLFIIFAPGSPHVRPVWTNIALMFWLVTMTIASSVIILHAPDQLQVLLQMKLAPVFDFRLAIFSLALLYFIASMIVQYLVQYMCYRIATRCRKTIHRSAAPLADSVELNVLYNPGLLPSKTQLFTINSVC